MAAIHNMLAGAGSRLQITVNIAANQTNYVFNTAKVPGYIPGGTDVIFNIAGGVIISASSTGVYAGNVDTSWAAGDTVRINNNGGVIVGCGGAGGQGGGAQVSNSTAIAGSGGGSGGPAFIAQRPIVFDNSGTIAGGGGGGGGGQGGVFGSSGNIRVAGGGGGGGRSSLAANAGGGAGGVVTLPVSGETVAQPGGTGTYNGQGGGGQRYIRDATVQGGDGGAGGAWGSAGNAGGSRTTGTDRGTTAGPYGGGAAGAAVSGNANITWVATGTRLGAIA